MNRIERRRQAKEDRGFVARGLDTERRDGLQVIALMRVLHERLLESRAARTVAPLMGFFHDNLRSATRPGPRHLLACRMGCAHCCHAWVSARAPEVLFVKKSLPAREREAIRHAVERAYAVTGTLAPPERAGMGTPCPLLRDNVCQAYGARPAVCQAAVSESAAICARAFAPGAADEDIPMPTFYLTLRRGYSLALAGALKHAGYAAESYEFNAALRAAFAREDAEAAWLAGEDVFAGVQRDRGSDPFAAPRYRQLYDAAWAD
ncbi:MAG TPA: YkgJ family cysteine cluster protein [Allosphingosinicella sp.]|nr:YkgJ family cysteine cluster protein [Allosphingosinicella sp.]